MHVVWFPICCLNMPSHFGLPSFSFISSYFISFSYYSSSSSFLLLLPIFILFFLPIPPPLLHFAALLFLLQLFLLRLLLLLLSTSPGGRAISALLSHWTQRKRVCVGGGGLTHSYLYTTRRWPDWNREEINPPLNYYLRYFSHANVCILRGTENGQAWTFANWQGYFAKLKTINVN